MKQILMSRRINIGAIFSYKDSFSIYTFYLNAASEMGHLAESEQVFLG